MNWGKSIAIAFIFFATFIIVLVSICMKQDVALVSATYYQEDLKFQDELNAKDNATHLVQLPEIRVEDGLLLIEYYNLQQVKEGKIFLQRPSDKRLDQEFEIENATENKLQFKTKNLTPGLYKLKFVWREGEQAYQINKTIVV
ncbi:MAG: FixH family protein [Cytophagales bacterium]|nr:FixH family protein [Cytophagales bacterium]